MTEIGFVRTGLTCLAINLDLPSAISRTHLTTLKPESIFKNYAGWR